MLAHRLRHWSNKQLLVDLLCLVGDGQTEQVHPSKHKAFV